MTTIHLALNNAYILFSFALGFWCIIKLVRDQGLDGQFWGAVALNTLLAVVILLLAAVMYLAGIRPHRAVYFLYGVYFAIVLPGTFFLLRGRDDRMAVIIFGIVTIFSGAAATRVPLLVEPWSAAP
ncbi:MAG: hypothetical protein HPY64_00345 [Anaerolineae bacterium]|nr:hypothetical protein [Anaerolineae bacterium]